MMRIVIDTNALVAARFAPDGPAARVLELCISGQVEAVVTPEIERENRDILKRVKPAREFWDRLERFYASAGRVIGDRSLQVTEDPGDDKYLECALAGRAGYIISSDRHLLDHNGYRGICICKAARFLGEWRKQ